MTNVCLSIMFYIGNAMDRIVWACLGLAHPRRDIGIPSSLQERNNHFNPRLFCLRPQAYLQASSQLWKRYAPWNWSPHLQELYCYSWDWVGIIKNPGPAPLEGPIGHVTEHIPAFGTVTVRQTWQNGEKWSLTANLSNQETDTLSKTLA